MAEQAAGLQRVSRWPSAHRHADCGRLARMNTGSTTNETTRSRCRRTNFRNWRIIGANLRTQTTTLPNPSNCHYRPRRLGCQSNQGLQAIASCPVRSNCRSNRGPCQFSAGGNNGRIVFKSIQYRIRLVKLQRMGAVGRLPLNNPAGRVRRLIACRPSAP
jgi:hypothetical protein